MISKIAVALGSHKPGPVSRAGPQSLELQDFGHGHFGQAHHVARDRRLRFPSQPSPGSHVGLVRLRGASGMGHHGAYSVSAGTMIGAYAEPAPQDGNTLEVFDRVGLTNTSSSVRGYTGRRLVDMAQASVSTQAGPRSATARSPATVTTCPNTATVA